MVRNLQNNIFAVYDTPIAAAHTQTEGCHSYDAAKKTRKNSMHVNGMPKANMFVKIRAIISAFDLNRVLSESGTANATVAAKTRGSTPTKARYPVKARPNMFPIVTL